MLACLEKYVISWYVLLFYLSEERVSSCVFYKINGQKGDFLFIMTIFIFFLFELLINCINLRNRLILDHRNATNFAVLIESFFLRLILWYLNCKKSRAEGIEGVGHKCFKVSQLIAFYCFGLIFITSMWLKARFMPVLYIDRIICLFVLKFSILQLAADETWKPGRIYMGF